MGHPGRTGSADAGRGRLGPLTSVTPKNIRNNSGPWVLSPATTVNDKTMKTLNHLLFLSLALLPMALAQENVNQPPVLTMSDKVTKTDNEWKKVLTPDQYYVLRQKGTERPFVNAYNGLQEHGIFQCAACGKELFSSDAKFESGTGWPSFYQPIAKNAVETKTDRSFFGTRTEVLCERCGGHLGHVFDDGPKPTGLRYCMNSAAMKFEKQP